MKISGELLDGLVAHALGDPHNEVCGLVAADTEPALDGHPVRAVRASRRRSFTPAP